MSTIMEARMNAYVWKQVLDIMKDMAVDANLVFQKSNIHIIALNSSKTHAVEFTTNNKIQYSRWSNHDLFIGVNLIQLHRIARTCLPTDIVSMEIHKDTPKVLKITTSNANMETLSVTSVYALDIPQEEPRLNPLPWSHEGSLPTTTFLRTVRDLSHSSKMIAIQTGKDDPCFLSLGAKSSESVCGFSTVISLCPSEQGLVWTKIAPETVRGQYLARTLEKFIKPGVSKRVGILFAPGNILRLAYDDLAIGNFSVTIASEAGDEAKS